MELIITKELLHEYFQLLTPRVKNSSEKLLQASIEDSGNKIKISSLFLEKLEDYFKGKGTQYLNFFQAFLTDAVNRNRIISFNIENDIEKEEHEILFDCYNYENKDYSFILTKNANLSLKNKLPFNISTYENIEKPNLDWLILTLASRTLVDVDHSYFQNRLSLETFITSLSRMSKNINKIEIIDSYFNTGEHNIIYSQLKSTKPQIKCYTRLIGDEDDVIKRRYIKEYFGKSKTSVCFSKNKKITHERKIGIGNLIMEFTHDFSEIIPQNKNWSIYLAICNKKLSLFQSNISQYN